MAVIYKTLFEVKLLHEYYLTQTDGITVFESATQDDRTAFLGRFYEKGAVSINADLDFDFPESLRSLYESYFLKVLPSYSGFRVLIRVNKKILTDQTLVYQPLASLPDNLAIHVLLKKKSSFIDVFTSARVNHPLPASYFFSNADPGGNHVSPFLTNPVGNYNSNYYYEQGELASFGTNDIQAYFENAGGEQWSPVKGTGFANEADRCLLSSRFNYTFPEESNVKNVTFTLKEAGGTVIDTLSANSTDRIQKFSLDYSAKVVAVEIRDAIQLNQSFFTLDVSGESYLRTHRLLINDPFYDRLVWGVVTMVPRPTSTDFHLLATDGFLHKRETTLTRIPHRVFEIPVRSRFTFWRYINDKKRPILANIDFSGYLTEEDGTWITNQPKFISKSFHKLHKDGGAETKYFPNPTDYSIKRNPADETDRRMFFHILVPRSKLFDV